MEVLRIRLVEIDRSLERSLVLEELRSLAADRKAADRILLVAAIVVDLDRRSLGLVVHRSLDCSFGRSRLGCMGLTC